MATLVGLHPVLMRPRVEALLMDAEARAWGVYIVSGFRSIEHQQRLYSQAVANCRKNPAKCPPSKWVARPGFSSHGPKVEHTDGKKYGIAVDFGIPGVSANAAGQWPQAVNDRFGALAGRHGLYQRMPWEDWHYEPIPHWTPPANSPAPPLLMEDFDMIAKDPADARRTWVREKFLEHLLRTPSQKDMTERVKQLEQHGADWVLAQITDSEEAKKIREKQRVRLGL